MEEEATMESVLRKLSEGYAEQPDEPRESKPQPLPEDIERVIRE